MIFNKAIGRPRLVWRGLPVTEHISNSLDRFAAANPAAAPAPTGRAKALPRQHAICRIAYA